METLFILALAAGFGYAMHVGGKGPKNKQYHTLPLDDWRDL